MTARSTAIPRCGRSVRRLDCSLAGDRITIAVVHIAPHRMGPRPLVAGVAWSAVYNAAWLVAWLAFMQREWRAAMDAIEEPLPWPSGALGVWAVLTMLFGVAIMLYAAGRAAPRRAAIHAGLALWIQLTIGMIGWGISKPLTVRVIAFD